MPYGSGKGSGRMPDDELGAWRIILLIANAVMALCGMVACILAAILRRRPIRREWQDPR